MPYCPQCGDEYEAGMVECFECQVPLVPTLDDARANRPDDTGGEKTVLFKPPSREHLLEMERCLEQFQVPFRKVEDVAGADAVERSSREGIDGDDADEPALNQALAVPAQFADRAVHVLSSVANPPGSGGASCGASCPGEECAPDEIGESDLLSRPLMEVARRGEECLDELIELVVRGNAGIKKRAVLVLILMGSLGEQAIRQLMKAALEEEQIVTVNILMSCLRGAEYTGPLWRDCLPFLDHERKIVRAKALEIIGHLGEPEAFPSVIPLLGDVEPAVRDEADNTLCQLSDEDMGFQIDASVEEQKRAVERWKTWWDRKAGWRNG
jgi:hypothetical protein